MGTFALIPGAGSGAWIWDRVVAELQRRGHDAVAVELPCDDPSAGLAEYADAVVEAIADRSDVVVVAQSLGGFTAPLVCERVPVALLVMLNAMIPVPGETPGEWWANTAHAEAIGEILARHGPMREWSAEALEEVFTHDVPAGLAAQAATRSREQSGTPFACPWPLHAWPDVPTRVLICREDRLFPLPFQRRVARERLGVTPEEMGGGHLAMLSRPAELAERLDAYATARSP
jgi:pimeloyl-ACP methyl ester carboxylesterase